MDGGDKRPVPPNSPDLTPSKINPNHPAALGLSGSSKKKPPVLAAFGASTADATQQNNATGSYFGGPITSNPGTFGGAANGVTNGTSSTGAFDTSTPSTSTALG